MQRSKASCHVVPFLAGLILTGCSVGDQLRPQTDEVPRATYGSAETVLGVLPDPAKVQRRLDQIKRRQFRCEAYRPEGESLRVLRLKLPSSAMPVDTRAKVKLVAFELSDGRGSERIKMQCGIPADADPLTTLDGLSYRSIARELSRGKGDVYTVARYREFVANMTGSARLVARHSFASSAASYSTASFKVATNSDPLCGANTAPSQGCTMLTGVVVTAPWEGIFAGFFPEAGVSEQSEDPWTSGSDTELPSVYEDEPCEYDCTPGEPPPCPTPSPFSRLLKNAGNSWRS